MTAKRSKLSLKSAAIALFVALLITAGTLITYAQSQDNNPISGFQECNVQVSIKTGTTDKRRTIKFATFNSMTLAQNVANELKVACADKNDPDGEVEKVTKRHKILWEKSASNGMFSVHALSGFGVVIFDVVSGQAKAFEIKQGKTDYFEQMVAAHQIAEVVVEKNYVFRGVKNEPMPTRDHGPYIVAPIEVELPKGWANSDMRLIVQPIAVECQTEDTVNYLQPFVFEGDMFHKLQDKRMAYDFMANDSLARGYNNPTPWTTLHKDSSFVFKTNVKYVKPDRRKKYKVPYIYTLEDYNHVANVYENPGSCLTYDPFKFLDFSVASAEIPLTPEFKEDAKAMYDEHQQVLDLRFLQGKDILIDDSLNESQRETLVKDLNSYGDKLVQIEVQGGSSPEGSIERNTILANQRADRAIDMLRGRVSGAVRRVRLAPKIYTWDDVVAALEKMGNSEITETVSNTVKNNKPNEVYGILKNLPFFESHIEPVLQRQRMMTFKYFVTREHVMEPEEARDEYFLNKQKYMSGEKHFSNGDYYNLFATIKDSAEVDNITRLAYNHLKTQPDWQKLPIAPYVANRMAIINNRRGTPDPELLRNFIDTTMHSINFIKVLDDYNKTVINREEIVMNQAIAFFLNQQNDSAWFFKERLIKDEKTRNKVDADKLNKLFTFIFYYEDFKNNKLKEGVTVEDMLQAENFVRNSSVDNNAIINTELHTQLKLKREDVEPLVDQMADNNPRKWYMKGILWCEEAGNEPEVSDAGNGFRELSDAEMMRLMNTDPDSYYKYLDELDKYNADKAKRKDNEELKKVPYFLAYFQHCFDLEPKFKKYYFREGNVNDKVRQAHPYRKKDIELYRRKFAALKAADDFKKAEQQGNKQTEKQTSDNNPETTTTHNEQ